MKISKEEVWNNLWICFSSAPWQEKTHITMYQKICSLKISKLASEELSWCYHEISSEIDTEKTQGRYQKSRKGSLKLQILWRPSWAIKKYIHQWKIKMNFLSIKDIQVSSQQFQKRDEENSSIYNKEDVWWDLKKKMAKYKFMLINLLNL